MILLNKRDRMIQCQGFYQGVTMGAVALSEAGLVDLEAALKVHHGLVSEYMQKMGANQNDVKKIINSLTAPTHKEPDPAA
jgi:hypothetical protein